MASTVNYCKMIFFSFLLLFTFLISTECKATSSSQSLDDAPTVDPRREKRTPFEPDRTSQLDWSLISQLSPGNLRFTKNLYDVVRREPGNLIFSPLSLELALLLIYNGASGHTSEEIKKSLGLPDSKQDSLNGAEAIMKISDKSDSNSLKIANGIFLHKDCNIKKQYIDSSEKHLSAEVRKLNFGRSSEAAKIINEFVDRRTNHTITNLVSPGDFDQRTRLVLVNTVYFMGTWRKQFYAGDTYEGDFHLNERDVKKVRFMTRTTNDFRIRNDEHLDATVMKMMYYSLGQRYKTSMVVLLPKKINGLAELEKKIKNVDLIQLAKRNLNHRQTEIHFPKFKIDKTLNLESVLTELGMREMFTEGKANFQGLTDDQDLFIRKVLQKAYIEVHEKGTVAAATTLLELVPTSLDTREPPKVVVDRPFIFYILDEEAELPLFMGRVVNP